MDAMDAFELAFFGESFLNLSFILPHQLLVIRKGTAALCLGNLVLVEPTLAPENVPGILQQAFDEVGDSDCHLICVCPIHASLISAGPISHHFRNRT